MSEGKEKVYSILKDLNIEYTRHEHKAVFTVDEANALDINLPGKHCKNLFLRNRKGNIHYLLVIEDHKRVDLKNLAKEIGSTPLSVASEERLLKHLALTPGSVTPFGLINDEQREVEVLIDKDLADGDYVNFHPNVNTSTLTISYKDFEKFLKWCGNKVRVVLV
ncbi:prolyl-tRNA synthetase associated domain-containing protein [Clostridium homopropionicum]|uniref:prolyl-tRNA synthetase associated domain-containing protein n=1 Tax=Clostridium homopropionicum TaxID=36844 RepID=UPI00069106C3|nr:prolyl-tRNA synthetase associated domain-containing protein [Clostridium homopropionicum]